MTAPGGILLVGGQSSRMGTDKALLPFARTTLIQYLISELQRATSDVLVVARYPQRLPELDVPVVADIHDIPCALSGVHAGLVHSTSRYNFVLACDLPLFTPRVVSFLAGFIGDNVRVVVPRGTRGYESLCAVYSKDLLPGIESNLARACLSLQELYDPAATRTVASADVEARTHPEVFFNMNTPEDYRHALDAFASLKNKKG